MRRTLALTACLLATAGGPLASPQEAPQDRGPQAGTQPRAAASVPYKPPAESRRLTEEDTPRPLLQILQNVGSGIREAAWSDTRSTELGTSLFARFDRLYEKERIQRLTEGFREGYAQMYIQIPQAVWLTAVEMASDETALDYYRIEMDALQIQLDATSQSEEAHVEIIHEGDVVMNGVDQAFEKRYDLRVGEQSPSRFFTLFGRAGRYTFAVTFLQSDLDEETGRRLLQEMAQRVREAAPLARPATGARRP